MYGRGRYSMDAIKEIRGTEEFKNMPINQRECQTKETFEQCNNNQLLGEMKKYCNCIPYSYSLL